MKVALFSYTQGNQWPTAKIVGMGSALAMTAKPNPTTHVKHDYRPMRTSRPQGGRSSICGV